MARLDKQLDKLSGERLVKLHWPEDGSIDIEMLRADLVREINTHEHRVPLDLRSVKGAPEDLVELLVDMERYARSKSKIMSMTWILPPLRDAIDVRAGRRSAPSNNEEHLASKKAREILNGNEKKAEYNVQSARKVERRKQPKKSKATNLKLLQLVALTLVGTLVVVGLMFYVLWESPSIVIDTEKIYE